LIRIRDGRKSGSGINIGRLEKIPNFFEYQYCGSGSGKENPDPGSVIRDGKIQIRELG
jgi:hypothetical protein